MGARDGSTPSGKPLKPLINESRYPYVVELAIPETGLEIELNSQIVGFHKSQRIQPRYGRRIMRDNQTYSRWCFSDLPTARALSNSLAERSTKQLALDLGRPSR